MEFVSLAARALGWAGVYTANIADGGALPFARAQVATVRAVFPVLAKPAVLRGRRFGNLILATSHVDLSVADLARRTASDPFPGRVEDAAAGEWVTGGAHPTTDGTATRSPQPPKGTWGLPG